MRVVFDRIEVRCTGRTSSVVAECERRGGWIASGAGDDERWSWWVADEGGVSAGVRSVAIVMRVLDVEGPLRMLRHGYQSWSPCDVATFGVDVDPSSIPGSVELFRGTFCSDQRVVDDPHELRSEWFTVLVDDGREPVFAGFAGGDRHDGVLRLRQTTAGIELWCEAFLGDAWLPDGAAFPLHDLLLASGVETEHLLARWAAHVGGVGGARVHAPYQVGWCSWYHYFHDVTERDVRSNLERADDWPFEVFQIDDGYQSAIGDWLVTNEKFESGLVELAASIAGRGHTPGLWIAPFIVAPDSRTALDHPDWLARDGNGEPLAGTFNPPWGGGRNGLMYALDPTRDEVVAHLEALASAIVAMGFGYLKLDFTFAPSLDGRWFDRSATPAQRVRAGFDAIRRGAGEETFLLGCGVPLANVVGVIDGARIGADVAPSWLHEDEHEVLVGFTGARPSTRHAWIHTATRSFLHRRLWSNDPDCLMLRSSATRLGADAARTWSRAVGVSGGMAIVSDDLELVDDAGRALLDEAVALGRMSDAAAQRGDVARAPGLLDAPVPSHLVSASGELLVDTATGASRFTPAR